MTGEPDLVSARLTLKWLILGEARAHPARFLGTAIVIAVGVALGFAVHLINGSALASFDSAVRSVNGAADMAVRATSPLGFDEMLYPEVLAAPGVEDASPVVSLDARAGDADFTLLGLDVIRAAAVTPSCRTRPGGPHAIRQHSWRGVTGRGPSVSGSPPAASRTAGR
jgi:putative ABC transport system permease protein